MKPSADTLGVDTPILYEDNYGSDEGREDVGDVVLMVNFISVK